MPTREHTKPLAFPAVPTGWQVAVPDFVGIGAQKAGTSWWYSLLAQHPQVITPKDADPHLPKELHYFDRFWDASVPTGEVENYQRYFPRPPGFITGEWTPRYLIDPWTIPLLARAAPDTKILVLLRDPVDRYISGFTHSLTHGMPRHARTASEAFHRGLYATHLKVVLEHFDHSQILVQQYEACRRSPELELKRTLTFLGLPTPTVMPTFTTPVNAARQPKEPLSPDLRQALSAAYRQDCVDLATMFSEIDLGLWPSATS